MKLKCYPTTANPPELAPARSERGWMDLFGDRHAYRCLPLTIANAYGWDILSPTTFSIYWNGGMAEDDIRFQCHDAFPDFGNFVVSNFARGVVTFHTGYIFRTDPGYSLLATGSFNEPKDGASPLTGVIETDWLPYPFTMNWQITRPGVVKFGKGEAFCRIFVVPQHVLEVVQPEIHALESDRELAAQYVAWREKRDQFMERFRARDPSTIREAWQKFYFKGVLPNDEMPAGHHVKKLRLPVPVDLRLAQTCDLRSNVAGTAGPIEPDAVEREVQNTTLITRTTAQRFGARGTTPVLCKGDFLTSEECDELVSAFERCKARLIVAPGRKDGFFDNRFLWINSLPTETERTAKRIMQTARFRCIEEVAKFYDEHVTIYSDTVQLVRWSQGMNMPVHADNSHPDGGDHPTVHRKYASVVYLNDNYDGGELIIPSLGLEIKPEKGLLVAFRGDRSHAHGVKEITRGTRYTMPGWYTDDIRHCDPYSSETY